jgi:lipopolysaccharide export system protein LptC
MDAAERAHTRRVQVLRVVLPTLAVAILATVFLVIRSDPPTPPDAGDAISAADLPSSMRTPSYASVGRDGTEVHLRAEEARVPKAAGSETTLSRATLNLVQPGGGRIDAVANEARLDAAAGRMALMGAVVIRDAQGWIVHSDLLTGTTDGHVLQSPGPVAAKGPAGTLDAGSMDYAGAVAGAEVVVFKGGVRLVYSPKLNRESPEP